jgi:predicted ATPase/Tfp pilus assembly protein PilF
MMIGAGAMANTSEGLRIKLFSGHIQVWWKDKPIPFDRTVALTLALLTNWCPHDKFNDGVRLRDFEKERQNVDNPGSRISKHRAKIKTILSGVTGLKHANIEDYLTEADLDIALFRDGAVSQDVETVAAAARLYDNKLFVGFNYREDHEIAYWINRMREEYDTLFGEAILRLHVFCKEDKVELLKEVLIEKSGQVKTSTYINNSDQSAELLRRLARFELEQKRVNEVSISIDPVEIACTDSSPGTSSTPRLNERGTQDSGDDCVVAAPVSQANTRDDNPASIWSKVPGDQADNGEAIQNLPPHNLLVSLTRFVGRQKQIAEVTELLKQTRLLTLTGSAGCGKTRMALAVGAKILSHYSDGVWFIELAALSDISEIPLAIAKALRLRSEPNISFVQTITEYLATRDLLLILDNCEHLINECAILAEELLRSCPHLTILATSREAMNISGEQKWRVPSLDVPQALPEELGALLIATQDYDAILFFADRVRSHEPNFIVDLQNAAMIANLCRHLDGIPLAIELAAARMRSLPLKKIEGGLADRFCLLTNGSRTAPPRHQTLRASIDWSYELLNAEEQKLLCNLSIFPATWTLDAAEAICIERNKAIEIIDVLAGLVDKSLVIYNEPNTQNRYRMLESIRQYGASKLEHEAAYALRLRHRAFYLTFAEQARQHIHGNEQEAWLLHVEAEYDNMRAALNSCLNDPNDDKHGLRLSAALFNFWQIRGLMAEGGRYYAHVLSLASAQAPTKARAEALNGAGGLAFMQGDYKTASACFSEAQQIWHGIGNRFGIASSIGNLGLIAKDQGDYNRARSLIEQSVIILEELGHQLGRASGYNNLGIIAWSQGEFADARRYYEKSLELDKSLDHKYGIASTLNNLGALAEDQGDAQAAYGYYKEGLALQRDLGDQWGIAATLANLGSLVVKQGDVATAKDYLKESLQLCRNLAEKQITVYLMDAVAEFFSTQMRAEKAVQYYAVGETLREDIGAPLLPKDKEKHDEALNSLLAMLGDKRFADADALGRTLTLNKARQAALFDLDS